MIYKTGTIVYLIIFLACFFGAAVYFETTKNKCSQRERDSFENGDKNEEYYGLLSRKERQANNRMQGVIILDDSTVHALPNTDMWYFVEKGDSVWKNQGSYKRFVRRKDSVFVFYPICGRDTIMDK